MIRYLLYNLERNWVLLMLSIASLIMALSVGHPLFFRLTYLFSGILIISALWSWFNVHWVRVTRQIRTHYVPVGQFFEERLIVQNTGPLPKLWLELKDFSNLPNHRASRVVSRLRRKQQRSWRIRTPCYQRGRYRIGPISVLSSDPFGLFLSQKNLPDSFSSHFVVYPLAFDLPGFQPPIGELTGGEAMHRRTHYVTTNVAGIRDYAFGDSFNRIHWRSTARLGRLMTKEFELDPMADVWLFLDLEKGSQAGLSYEALKVPQLPATHWEKLPQFHLPRSTEEYGVTIAASLAKHFLRQDRSLGLVTYPNKAHREMVQGDRGERQLTRIYEVLAVIQAKGTIPFANVLATEGLHLSRSMTALIITASLAPEWVAATRHLTDRGIRVTTIFIDPTSFGGTPTSTTTEDIEIELIANHIPYYIVRYGDNIAAALSSQR